MVMAGVAVGMAAIRAAMPAGMIVALVMVVAVIAAATIFALVLVPVFVFRAGMAVLVHASGSARCSAGLRFRGLWMEPLLYAARPRLISG
jgi:hypothetical protein